MNKKDYYNLEDQIMSTVSSALKAIDNANLKIDINYKPEDAINQFKSKFNSYSEKYMGLNKKTNNDMSKYISKRPPGSISGILCIVVGSVGSVISASSMLAFLIANAFLGRYILGGQVVGGVLVLFFVGSGALLLKGINLRKRVQRFKRYAKLIDGRSYFPIKDIAKFVKEKERFVIKDLNKMVEKGMFLEGHIDEENTYFILNDEVYNHYLNLKKQQIAKESEEKKEKEDNSQKEDAKSTIKVGRDYIEQIKIVRKHLYREDIAINLDKLVNISQQILNQVEKKPQKAQEVNKFINHYLPITMKLINAYEELNNQVVQGENIKKAKSEIEKSIELINSAFENLLDDLFEDVALDISTDISVLKTLFKQEGLGEEDFK